jgi:DNA polymerase-4
VLLGDEDLALWKSGLAKYKMGFHWESYLHHKQQFDNYKAHRGRYSERTFKSIIDAKLIPTVCSSCGFQRSKWADVSDARLILRIERVLRPSKSTDFAMELKEIKLEHFGNEPLQTSYTTFAEKFLAKVASELDKTRGFSVLGSEAPAVLAPRPVSILPGVGPVFRKTLQSDGYATVGDLAAADVRELARRYGETGLRLHDLAHGRDARAVNPGHERKGMSAETTFNEDLTSAEDLEAELWPLCEKLASKARRDGVASRVLVLKLRRTDFRIVTRRISLPEPVQTARALFAAGRALMAPELGRPYRLIGIGMGEIIDATDSHALFETAETRALRTETAIDALRAKFGAKAVVAGRALKD